MSRRLEAKTMEEKTAASCLLPRPGTTRLPMVSRTTSAGVAFAHSELGSLIPIINQENSPWGLTFFF